MVSCPLCDRRFMDRRGLHGHFRFVHGIEYGSRKRAKKTILTEAVRKVVERYRKVRREAEKEAEGKKSKSKIFSLNKITDDNRGTVKPFHDAKRGTKVAKVGFSIGERGDVEWK